MKERIIREDLEDIYSRDVPWESLRGNTVLLTGAYGMLASYVMYVMIYLNEVHHMDIRIVAIVRSKEKFLRRYGEYAQADYISLRTDGLDDELHLDDDIDFIIHAASLASPQYYSSCPVDVLKPNVIGTYHLLELAREKKIKGFLLFSTGDIYGVINGKEVINEHDMGALDPLDIHSCYSESKRMAEAMCYSYFFQYSVPIKIARIWHTYAPTMDIENDPRVFSSFVKNIIDGDDIVMKSDGSGKRSFCYIADAVAGYFLILLSGVTGEAYNVCNSSEYVSMKELAWILAGMRKDMQLSVITKERDSADSYTENTAIGDVPPSDQKLKSLGWTPQYSIQRGFERTVRYIQSNRATGEGFKRTIV